MRTVIRRWFENPWWDWVGAGAVLSLVAWCSLHSGPLGLQGLEPDTRRAVYQTLTTVSGTLLGLVLTSISVLNTVLRQPMTTLASKIVTPVRRQAVGKLFFAAIRALAIALDVNLFALLTDSDAAVGRGLTQSAVLAGLVLIVARLARAMWALALIVGASAIAPSAPAPARPPISDDEY